HKEAGKIIRQERNIYQRWRRIFADKGAQASNNYQPFSSRLEWEISQWAVKEKISQKSFDRFLKIPEV
ncbi:hypothetical protein EV360DRAFT_29816, partial [Lentinula raphanica]